MKNITSKDVEEILINELTNQGTQQVNIDPKSNLLEAGILDSISFLNFIVKLEDTFDTEIDFSELEPAEFTSIENLTQLINQNS